MIHVTVLSHCRNTVSYDEELEFRRQLQELVRSATHEQYIFFQAPQTADWYIADDVMVYITINGSNVEITHEAAEALKQTLPNFVSKAWEYRLSSGQRASVEVNQIASTSSLMIVTQP